MSECDVKKSYCLSALIVGEGGDTEKRSFCSNKPFHVPKVGEPLEVAGEKERGSKPLVGIVDDVAFSYEYELSDRLMVCNTNITLTL